MFAEARRELMSAQSPVPQKARRSSSTGRAMDAKPTAAAVPMANVGPSTKPAEPAPSDASQSTKAIAPEPITSQPAGLAAEAPRVASPVDDHTLLLDDTGPSFDATTAPSSPTATVSAPSPVPSQVHAASAAAPASPHTIAAAAQPPAEPTPSQRSNTADAGPTHAVDDSNQTLLLRVDDNVSGASVTHTSPVAAQKPRTRARARSADAVGVRSRADKDVAAGTASTAPSPAVSPAARKTRKALKAPEPASPATAATPAFASDELSSRLWSTSPSSFADEHERLLAEALQKHPSLRDKIRPMVVQGRCDVISAACLLRYGDARVKLAVERGPMFAVSLASALKANLCQLEFDGTIRRVTCRGATETFYIVKAENGTCFPALEIADRSASSSDPPLARSSETVKSPPRTTRATSRTTLKTSLPSPMPSADPLSLLHDGLGETLMLSHHSGSVTVSTASGAARPLPASPSTVLSAPPGQATQVARAALRRTTISRVMPEIPTALPQLQ